MGNISEAITKRWEFFSTVAATTTGGIGVALAMPELGILGIGVGVLVAGGTALGAALFRPRSQEEINALLGLEPVHLTPALEAGEKKPNIKNRTTATKHLNKILGEVLDRKDALGEEIVTAFTRVCENLNSINKQWDRLALDIEKEHTVESILSDHLPTSLEAYINVSKNERIKNQDTLKAEIIRQLGIMEETTNKILQSFERQDVAALQVQGKFLESRFADSVKEEEPRLIEANQKPALRLGDGTA